MQNNISCILGRHFSNYHLSSFFIQRSNTRNDYRFLNVTCVYRNRTVKTNYNFQRPPATCQNKLSSVAFEWPSFNRIPWYYCCLKQEFEGKLTYSRRNLKVHGIHSIRKQLTEQQTLNISPRCDSFVKLKCRYEYCTGSTIVSDGWAQISEESNCIWEVEGRGGCRISHHNQFYLHNCSQTLFG
jgi:hypothetical protein